MTLVTKKLEECYKTIQDDGVVVFGSKPERLGFIRWVVSIVYDPTYSQIRLNQSDQYRPPFSEETEAN